MVKFNMQYVVKMQFQLADQLLREINSNWMLLQTLLQYMIRYDRYMYYDTELHQRSENKQWCKATSQEDTNRGVYTITYSSEDGQYVDY